MDKLLLNSIGVLNIESITTAIETAFKSVADNAMSGIGKILPIALPVVGAFLTINLAMKAFKKLVNK